MEDEKSTLSMDYMKKLREIEVQRDQKVAELKQVLEESEHGNNTKMTLLINQEKKLRDFEEYYSFIIVNF